jgi:hypothetical protein
MATPIFKTITSKENTYIPFEVSVVQEQDSKKLYLSVEPRSVIYRSFNLKDMMIHTGFIDKATESIIQGFEGTLSGHAICGLDQKFEIDKENKIIYLEVGIGPNLYATGAEVKIGNLDNPWSGYPEPFKYNPSIEFDKEGNLKDSIVYRRQTAAYFPLAYLTNDTSQIGKIVPITKGGNEVKEVNKLVQVINYNIMMTTFNYDGNPVAYGIPFMNPFFYYSSSSTQ